MRMNSVRFSAEWLEDGINESAELRATDCFLEIFVGERRVSRFVDNRTDRAHDRVVMPAYPPAEGIVRNWWSLIAGRTQTFRLRSFREGFALPDIRLEPDGRFINITVEPFEYNNPPVNFTARSSERMPIGAFERDMIAFIESVLERLSEEKVKDSWLQARWDAIVECQQDPDELAFCEAAGALGVDPYLCTDEEASLVEMSAKPFADDALPEFLAGCALDGIREALKWVDESEAALGDRATLPDLPGIASAVQERLIANGVEERPWEVGYLAATACREQIDLPATRSLREPSEIASLFGAFQFKICPSRVNGLRAEVNGAEEHPRVVVAGPGHPTSLNFATMRAIGDYLVYRSGGRAPINDTYSYRQAVGRAFAAEMLAPAEVITQMQDAGMGVEEIAAERNVSEMAVMHHLENHSKAQLT